jgi:hypothetical protein
MCKLASTPCISRRLGRPYFKTGFRYSFFKKSILQTLKSNIDLGHDTADLDIGVSNGMFLRRKP